MAMSTSNFVDQTQLYVYGHVDTVCSITLTVVRFQQTVIVLLVHNDVYCSEVLSVPYHPQTGNHGGQLKLFL